MVLIFIFIIFYFYYYSILFASLPFSMANHLGLDKFVSQMVGKWGVICKCSTPVGAPGHITKIEHHDNISFSRHSQLTKFWEPNLANPVWTNDVIKFFLQSWVKYLSFMVAFTVWLVQEYACSSDGQSWLETKSHGQMTIITCLTVESLCQSWSLTSAHCLISFLYELIVLSHYIWLNWSR